LLIFDCKIGRSYPAARSSGLRHHSGAPPSYRRPARL